MSETLETMDRLRKEAERLLRELELALVKAHLAFGSWKQAAQPFQGRFKDLYRKMDQEVNVAPQTKTYYHRLKESVETQRQAMLREAERVYRERDPGQGLGGQYNQFVGDHLALAPGEGRKLVEGQVDTAVRKLVDSVVNHPDVPGNVRAQMARALSDWVKQQEFMQDAFYLVQTALVQVSQFLHHKLTIQAQIVHTRDSVKQRNEVTASQIKEADEHVGRLAKQSRDLDRQIEQSLQSANLSVRTYIRLNPKLVLDPAKAFLSSLELRAGVKLQQHGVTVDLGAGVKVVDPMSPDQLQLGTGLGVSSGDFRFGIEGGSTYDTGQGSWNHSVRAKLTWTF